MFYHFEPWPNFKLSSTQITSYFTISVLKSLDFVPLDKYIYIYRYQANHLQKRHWRRYEVAKVGGLAIQVSNGPFVSEYSNTVNLFSWKPKQPFFNGWKCWNNHVLRKDWVHHPTETTIFKWMFQVPGIYWSIPWHVGLATKNTETFWGYLKISEDMLRIPHEVPGCCNTFAPRLVACSSLATSESAIALELWNTPSYFPLYWLFTSDPYGLLHYNPSITR